MLEAVWYTDVLGAMLQEDIPHCPCCTEFDEKLAAKGKHSLLNHASKHLFKLCEHTMGCGCEEEDGAYCADDSTVVCPEIYKEYARRTDFDMATYVQWVPKALKHLQDAYKDDKSAEREQKELSEMYASLLKLSAGDKSASLATPADSDMGMPKEVTTPAVEGLGAAAASSSAKNLFLPLATPAQEDFDSDLDMGVPPPKGKGKGEHVLTENAKGKGKGKRAMSVGDSSSDEETESEGEEAVSVKKKSVPSKKRPVSIASKKGKEKVVPVKKVPVPTAEDCDMGEDSEGEGEGEGSASSSTRAKRRPGKRLKREWNINVTTVHRMLKEAGMTRVAKDASEHFCMQMEKYAKASIAELVKAVKPKQSKNEEKRERGELVFSLTANHVHTYFCKEKGGCGCLGTSD